MATQDPVNLGTTGAYVVVYDGTVDGSFTGAVQQVGGGPAVLRVETSPGVPTVGAGGFAPTQAPAPITLSATEVLYGRSDFGASIVLA